MSSVIINNHLALGVGRSAAFSFGDTKERHTLVKPEDTLTGKFAKWGDDNLYPQNYMKTLKKNGAGGASYRFLKATHYGQGFQLYREDSSDDGKRDREMVPLSSQKETYEFFRRNKMPRIWTELIADLETWNLAFPEFILTNDYSEVASLRRMQTAKMRYERINEKTGLIENAYFCHNWKSSTDVDSDYVKKIPVIDSYCTAEEIKEYCKKKKIHKFTMPIFYPLIDETYYPEPEGHSVYRNGWMDVTNNIPEYKKHFSEQRLNVDKMVYISDEYFTRTYGDDWQKFTPEKKKEIRQQLADDIDDYLSGNKNAGKSIQSTVFKDREGKWVKGIEVVAIESGNNTDGQGILDASAGNSEIVSAIGAFPSLMGVGIPGSKLGGDSGSDKREAFSILNSLFKTKRETTLEIWRMLRDYNGWDSALEGDFAVTELTTLDKNPTGTENKL